MTTKATRSRARWSSAVLVSPLVAALAAGSILWAADHDPRASAQTPTQTVQQAAPAAAPAAEAQPASTQPSIEDLRKTLTRLDRKVTKARAESKAARVASANSGGTATDWSAPSSSGSNSGSSGAAAAEPAPAPAPAPEPPPADTWTGSSGG